MLRFSSQELPQGAAAHLPNPAQVDRGCKHELLQGPHVAMQSCSWTTNGTPSGSRHPLGHVHVAHNHVALMPSLHQGTAISQATGCGQEVHTSLALTPAGQRDRPTCLPTQCTQKKCCACCGHTGRAPSGRLQNNLLLVCT